MKQRFMTLAFFIGLCWVPNAAPQPTWSSAIPPQIPENIPISGMIQKIESGTPSEKEEALTLFMENGISELVPEVINCLLDDTVLPRHDDAGWGRVHHLAANALGEFARRHDGKTLEERGRDAFSFFSDGGAASEQRREQVHGNWTRWWLAHRETISRASNRAAPFETESWPGEGIPVFAAKTSALRLNEKPSEDSPRITIACKAGQRIEFDQSRQITMQSVFLTAKKAVADLACPDKNIKIDAGDTVEYLQYRAEGYGIVRVKGTICEVFVNGQDDFDGLKAPVSQWWVRVVGKNQTPLGWLRVESGQAMLLPRKF